MGLIHLTVYKFTSLHTSSASPSSAQVVHRYAVASWRELLRWTSINIPWYGTTRRIKTSCRRPSIACDSVVRQTQHPSGTFTWQFPVTQTVPRRSNLVTCFTQHHPSAALAQGHVSLSHYFFFYAQFLYIIQLPLCSIHCHKKLIQL